ncbi:MAG: (2Fe-2S)-binding protein, partial [Nocardiopsaceae bacterium]|nr:(2Fe-2S)-binding protein [Nocardiopsaceae bacterium]
MPSSGHDPGYDGHNPGQDPGDVLAVRAVVNGREVRAEIPPGTLLLDFLRDHLGLTGAKRSCDLQVCGACTVLVDQAPVSACCHLAADIDGRSVTTVEGLAGTSEADRDPVFAALEDRFVRNAAVQCGFCTPGFMVTLHHLIAEGQLTPDLSEPELRHLLRGNICRCTGYQPILRSAREAARDL